MTNEDIKIEVIAYKTEIDAYLDKIQQKSNDMFDIDEESASRSDLNALSHIMMQLKQVHDQLYLEGDYSVQQKAVQ